jgi:effector-binding domain-containing protein
VEVDKGELSRGALEEIERKAMQDFPRYQNLDLANIISSFLKLNYVPREILAEINQMQSLSFNKYSCLLILESLVYRKYDETFELYDKLFKQLQKNSLNMNPKLIGRTI